MADAEVVYGVSVQGFAEAQTALRAAYTEQQRALDLAREVEAAEAAAHAEDRARTARSIQMARERAKAAAEEFDINVDAMERELELRREVEAAEKAAHAEERARVAKSIQMARDLADETKRVNGIKQDYAAHAIHGAKSTGAWSASLHDATFAIKEVGKDLDNFGLKAGKTFAMTVEGGLSVVAALGAGGVAGVIGAATVAVGYLANAWSSHNAEVAAAKKAVDDLKTADKSRFDSLISQMRTLRTAQAEKSVDDLEDIANARQADVIFLQATRERIKLQMGLEREGSEERNRLAQEVRDYSAKLATAETERVAAVEAHRVAQAEASADKMAKIEVEEAEASLRGQMEEDDKKAAARKNAAEKAAKDRSEELAALQRLHDADMALNDAKWAAEDKAKADAKKADMDLAQRLHDADMKMNDEKWADEDKAAEDTKKANEEAAKSEAKRREELEKTAKALRDKQKADAAAAMAAAYSTQVNLAFGVSSTVVMPVINELTGTIRQLGDVNRDTYKDFVLFSDQLPAIIAKKTQAILGGIAAEATGKSLQSVADSAREFALGSGLVFIPGMQAQAAGHFTSAAAHMVAASAYAAIGGGAAVGAVGLGAMRGSGGPIALTREEQQRNASRDGGGAGGGGGISGGRMSGSGGGDGGAFVVNIAYQAGSIAPADENRAARTVASATRRARSNAFDRRRMGA